eukprot:2649739-Rhodomonas_salina.4
MSGTRIAYGRCLPTCTLCDVRYCHRSWLLSPCACHAKSGTEIGNGNVQMWKQSLGGGRYKVAIDQEWSISCPRACYAMSGTHTSYAHCCT